MDPFRANLFAGKTAFIAGGTSGINLGIAKRLAGLGARVSVAGRNPEKAEGAAREIGGTDVALGLSCDTSLEDGLRRTVQWFRQAREEGTVRL